MPRCYDLLLGACVHPKQHPPPPRQAGAAQLTKAPALGARALLSPTCIPEDVRQTARPRDRPCRHTWGISVG